MEESSSSFKSRNLKKCFGKNIFSLFPFEIWRDVLCEGEGIVVCRLAQTCWGFKELVDNLRELLLEYVYALKYRREDKIEIAKNLILRCADIGHHMPMLHIGFAYWTNGGWGLNEEEKKGVEWFKKAAELGNVAAMAFYAHCLIKGVVIRKDEELGKEWAKKTLLSNNSFAVGYCYYWGMLVSDEYKAFEMFKLSAEEGDEFGQAKLGHFYDWGIRVDADLEQSFNWHLKSAKQGFAESQYQIGLMLLSGNGCEQNEEFSKIWLQKALNQGYKIE